MIFHQIFLFITIQLFFVMFVSNLGFLSQFEVLKFPCMFRGQTAAVAYNSYRLRSPKNSLQFISLNSSVEREIFDLIIFHLVSRSFKKIAIIVKKGTANGLLLMLN